MSFANSATISSSDPNFTDDKSSVTKTVTSKGANDTVSVDAAEDGVDPKTKNAVIVLKIDSDGKSTASTNSGVVKLSASGSGTTQYLQVELNSSDNGNWTVYVDTNGGSTYTFTKGNGGGGHK